jgi:hypothetical protein
MNDNDIIHFLTTIANIGGPPVDLNDYCDSISFAMDNIPMISENEWFGLIIDQENLGMWGTYYSSFDGWRWFPQMGPEEASQILNQRFTNAMDYCVTGDTNR